MHNGLRVGKGQLLPQHTAFMYLLCLCHVEVWPILHCSPEFQTQDTHSARLNMELTWESLRASLRRMPGHGVCRRASGWQWSLGPWADGLLEAYWREQRSEGEEGGRVQTGRSGSQLKGRLVLLFSKNSRTMLQFKSQQKANVCVFRFVCWHAFKPFIPTTLLCMNKLCKKSVCSGVKRRPSLWQVRQPALCWLLVLSAAAFMVFPPHRALFTYFRDLKSFYLHFLASGCKTNSKIFFCWPGSLWTNRFQWSGGEF